jgi:hypothetical protein
LAEKEFDIENKKTIRNNDKNLNKIFIDLE